MTHDLSFEREAAYVNGRWIAADSGKTFAVTNPANGETLGTAPDCGKAETARAIKAADAALPAWRTKTAKERAKILHRLADVIENNLEPLGVLLTMEQGKS
jgi:succinate-semialdehyde dehydrogenase / glutarate-semialdehyde dehydrogenase